MNTACRHTSVLLFLLQSGRCIKMLILLISTNHKYNLKFITTLFILTRLKIMKPLSVGELEGIYLPLILVAKKHIVVKA